MNNNFIYGLFLLFLVISLSCKDNKETAKILSEEPMKELSFERRVIADSVELLWCRDLRDMDGDGLADLVFIENNGYGGLLGYYQGKKENGIWKKVIINEEDEFAMGDLETADMDGDGDWDIIAAHHPGEWEDANAPSQVFWFENPNWAAHPVGEAPDFIKDVSVEDFDADGKLDIAVLTFEESSLRVFQQNEEGWTKVLDLMAYKNLHEGMHTGDLNGDGFPDIVAEAHVFYSPGEDLTQKWQEETIDEKWNNQTGDWSRNGTKIFVRDLDGDGKAEVFVSHSERSGYPLAYYKKEADGWKEHVVIDSIAACHTLQVYDFDQDGYYDVLTGVNQKRAMDLGLSKFPVLLLKGSEGYQNWENISLADDGIYNGQAGDYDGDGDIDIIKYQTHDATQVELLENKLVE